MAEIFLARPLDAALSKLVALKRILPEHSAKAQYREMFRREGEIALRFRHPAIVTVHEVGKVQDSYYMSMEFFPGKTLAQLILRLREDKDALEIRDKVYIIKCIADALQYIHDFSDHGELTEIIHRDISPQNILVGYDGATKLIDFGVAKVNNVEEGTSSKDLKGKIAYMSPEQVLGEDLTKQTDIFSLGIVLWEVLAGRKLFIGNSAKEVSRLVEDCNVPLITQFVPEIPIQLARICHEALAKNVKHRYQNAGDLSADLDDVLRKYPREQSHKRISSVLQRLFPVDVSRLHAVLKKHENSNRSSETASGMVDVDSLVQFDLLPEVAPELPTPIPQSVPPESESDVLSFVPPAISAPASMADRTQPKVSKSFDSSISGAFDREKISTWRSLNIWLVIGALCVATSTAIVLDLPSKLLTATRAALTPSPVFVAQPPTLTVIQPTKLAALPAPTAVPIATPVPIPVSVPVPVPAPVQPLLAGSAAQPQSKPLVSATVTPVSPAHEVESARAAKTAVQNRLRPKAQNRSALRSEPRAKKNKKSERKTASQIPSQAPFKAFAMLTVLADPEAQILIDGKPAGIEVVNNYKVPPDRKIVVTVIPKSGVGIKVQRLQLKAFSRNVIEMTGPSDKP
jgi:serine/threonine protein kinase